MKDSKIEQGLEVSSSFTDAVDGDFTDSTQTMVEAEKKGLKGEGPSDDDTPCHAPRYENSGRVLEYRQ